MQQVFTKEFMQANKGCYDDSQLAKCSFMKSEPITLESIIKSEIPLKDKFWFVCKKVATKEENQQIAIGVAEIVLPIFESRYPYDKRPREAIQAAKQYIAGHITLHELISKRNDAAAAAYAAAYAADNDAAAYAAAAYAATYAADADAAADAADAAAAAAADADAAADAADASKIYTEQLEIFIYNFCTQLNIDI